MGIRSAIYIAAAAVCLMAPLPGRAQTPAASGGTANAQGSSASDAGQDQSGEPEDQPGAHGTVLFSRGLGSAPEAASGTTGQLPSLSPGDADPLHVTDAERSAETFTAYGLELRLRPEDHAISATADVAVRNDGRGPLTRIVLQVSSSLVWDEVLLRKPDGSAERLKFDVRRLATDADHTGWVAELVAKLPEPLAPGASVRLRGSYAGTIAASAERLERIGAPDAEAAAADWDAIDAAGSESPGTSVALRGFGDVLWYPVSTPAVFLGDGAKLFDAVGKMRLLDQDAAMKLRISVEFSGDPPDAVFFCGRVGTFKAQYDNPDVPVAAGTGVATAEFPEAPLGFRLPSLFVTDHPATPAGTDANPDMIAAVTEQFPALKVYSAAATQVEPMLTDWLGAHPMGPLHLLDHPGQPFEDDTVLLRPIGSDTEAGVAGPLVHSLTHAWIHSERPWIDEGLAQFMGLVWTERTAGRQTVLEQLEGAAKTISLGEPAPGAAENAAPTASSSSSSSTNESTNGSIGQPLVRAWSDVYYRTKAAAVWWMLRDIVGDAAMKRALAAYRADAALDRDPEGMERALEQASHQDLRWFFTDWVYEDRGLPDLTVVNVTPRKIEATGGRGGYLVSVEVRNDGEAVADVPVTVRSAPGASGASAASETQRMRIPPHETVTHRIVFPVTPAEVQVNDGGVLEMRVSVHKEELSGVGG